MSIFPGLDIDPFAGDIQENNMVEPIDFTHLTSIKVVNNTDQHRPFTWAHKFRKRSQEVSRHAFKETHDEICRFLDDRAINYGLLILLDGIMVFTEGKQDFNGMLVKLTLGMDLTGQQEFNLTHFIRKHQGNHTEVNDTYYATPNYDALLRDK
jgi:uncharacterized membrane-anchored protein